VSTCCSSNGDVLTEETCDWWTRVLHTGEAAVAAAEDETACLQSQRFMLQSSPTVRNVCAQPVFSQAMSLMEPMCTLLQLERAPRAGTW